MFVSSHHCDNRITDLGVHSTPFLCYNTSNDTNTLITLRPHQQRALDAMSTADKGQIIVPTGGGKTFIMIQHAKKLLETPNMYLNRPKHIVVVAPRILLAQQLCDDFMEQVKGRVCHAHSGETHYYSTTKALEIANFVEGCRALHENAIIFTTYHSLHRVLESDIPIDAIYFDEAHNSVTRQFFPKAMESSKVADKCYFFTATPRTARKNEGIHTRGMNNKFVYGDVLESVPAPELIANGSIVSPTIVPFTTEMDLDRDTMHETQTRTVINVLDTLDEESASKVLIAVPSSRILGNMIGHTTLLSQLRLRGYDYLHVTSKYGAYINDKKVNREEFMTTLSEWGKDNNKKFVVMHYSILSEGINVHGLTHCILLRNLNVVSMAQTIGRVIRMHKDDTKAIAEGRIPAGACQFYRKPTGYLTVPIHNNYGNAVVKRLQRVVDEIFVKGVAPTSIV